MNKQIRNIFIAISIMVVILLASTTIIQFFQAPALNANGWNSREIYINYSKPRGAIIAGGKTVAYSTKVNDRYRYQRVYADAEGNKDYADVYAPITGFFSIVAKSDRGIEMAENDQLNGSAGTQWFSHFRNLLTNTPQGGSVELTIDPVLQKTAYDALGDRKGAVVAIEPSTGRILAMVSKPSFNPNLLASHDSALASKTYADLTKDNQNSPLINFATRQYYPPGSTFKVITAAAALESGKYNPDTMVDAPQSLILPGTNTPLINYANEHCSASGKQSMQDALQMSCNTAFAGIGMALGADALEAQAEKFGVGTAFTLAGKGDTAMKSVKTSILQSDYPNYKRSLDKVGLASIGQGEDNFTVLQDALISAAVANGGVLMNPYLVENVYDSQNDLVEKTKPTEFSRAVSQDNANKLRDMMIRVTHTGGSAPNLQIPGIEVAAKTGTAQEETHEVPDAWVTAFAPATNPKIALAVFIQDGEDDPTGASAAAPVAKQILLAAGVGNVDK